MRAVKHTERGIEVLEVPKPEGDGVRVRPRAVGICGSDLKLIDMGPLPQILGHEISGLLDDGTPVAIEPFTGCGACDRCRAGEFQQCPGAATRLHGIGLDGGMAEEMVVDARSLVRLAPSVDVMDASLVEPLAVAVHAGVRAGLSAGQRVAIIGAGPIGLAAVAAVQRSGCEVDLFARHAHQLEAGEKLSAGLEQGRGYDVVFDAAGSDSSLREALSVVRRGGSVVLVASFFGDLTLSGLMLTTKEITLVPAMLYGVSAAGREVDTAAALLASRPELADALITHRVPLDEAAEAFRLAGDRSGGTIKVVVEI